MKRVGKCYKLLPDKFGDLKAGTFTCFTGLVKITGREFEAEAAEGASTFAVGLDTIIGWDFGGIGPRRDALHASEGTVDIGFTETITLDTDSFSGIILGGSADFCVSCTPSIILVN